MGTPLKPEPDTPTAWASRAKPGERMHLPCRRPRQRWMSLASAAWLPQWMALSDQQIVVLFQRRLRANNFEYLAVRTAKPLDGRPPAGRRCRRAAIIDRLIAAA